MILGYGNSSTLPRRLNEEKFDVVFASTLVVDKLVQDGKVASDSRESVARVPVGMGVKKGARKPDIGTIDAFKNALLEAKSISHASDGPSGIYLQALFKKMGIETDVQSKLRPVAGGPLVMGPVARGDVEIGIITVPFIIAEQGADLVGPLPDQLQEYVVYALGVAKTSVDPISSKALISHILSPTSGPVFRSQGLDPIAPK